MKNAVKESGDRRKKSNQCIAFCFKKCFGNVLYKKQGNVIATNASINNRRYSFSTLAKKGTFQKLICNIQATSSVNTVSKITMPPLGHL